MFAGSLIIPTYSFNPPESEDEAYEFIEGIGLIDDVLFSPHFTEWNQEENLKK